MSGGKRKKAIYGLVCAYNIVKIVMHNGGKIMDKFLNWVGEIVELYGESILTFIVVAFAIGLLMETIKRAVFNALDTKYPESEKVATAKSIFSIATAVALEIAIFRPALNHGTWIGGEYGRTAWYVLMYYAQMGADLKAIKKIWNWILYKINAPKVEKQPVVKMKTITVAEINPQTGVLEYVTKQVPKDTVIKKAPKA